MVRRMSVPFSPRDRMASHSSRRLRGSRPVVGSSRRSRRGDPTRLAPRSRRRRIPPEYVLTRRCPASARSSRSRVASLAARAVAPATARRAGPPWSGSRGPSSSPPPPRTARPDRSCWRTTSASRTTSWPATCMVPPSGCKSVATVRTKVVLPAPFGPKMATICPGGRLRSSPAKAVTCPKRLVRPRASMRAVMDRSSLLVRLVPATCRGPGGEVDPVGALRFGCSPERGPSSDRSRGSKAPGPRARTRGPEPFPGLGLGVGAGLLGVRLP